MQLFYIGLISLGGAVAVGLVGGLALWIKERRHPHAVADSHHSKRRVTASTI